MRLTRFSDNALRCLMALAVHGPEPVPTERIAQQMAMSNDHLVKVVRRLAALGYVETLRGRQGGVRLARVPAAINVGAVIRSTEDNLTLVECFNAETNACPITAACGLAPVLGEALDAFLCVLDRFTLADVVDRPAELVALMRR